MPLILDHILLGAPDLDRAVAAFAAAAGVTPAGGGAHPGFATHNQLLSLGEGLFFEIIAPDPAQVQRGQRADELADYAAPRMHAFCLRTANIASAASTAVSAGLRIKEPVSMSRTRPDGVRLEWQILYFDEPEWGHALPFLIDWQDSPHPARSAPSGASLTDFTVLHPRARELTELYQALGIAVSVKRSPWPGFVATLSTPNGSLVLT